MIKTTTAVISALLAAGCASAPADKTPRTVSGQLNSCMLGEIYGRQEAGKLAADEWTAAREVFGKLHPGAAPGVRTGSGKITAGETEQWRITAKTICLTNG